MLVAALGIIFLPTSGFVLGYMDQPWIPPPVPDVRLEPDLICKPDCMIIISGLNPNWTITAYPDLIDQGCLGSAASGCSAMYSYDPYEARLFLNDTDLTFDNTTLTRQNR